MYRPVTHIEILEGNAKWHRRKAWQGVMYKLGAGCRGYMAEAEFAAVLLLNRSI